MRIYVIGAPGSGNGTLCARWCSESDFVHISVGDHLRALAANDQHQLDPDMLVRIQNQQLLTTSQIIHVLCAVMEDEKENLGHIMLDGFPRTLEQSDAADKAIGEPHLMILLECPRELAKERYLSRKIAGRDSDPEVFDKRYEEYEWENAAIKEKYLGSFKLVIIDSSGATEKSYEELKRQLGERGIKPLKKQSLKRKAPSPGASEEVV